MKSRSNRNPTSDPPDDWVDGSWTVDCICGVNFDDGEEMVNCDECAVWVHTRCVRFVKGEKSFACDKCKSKGSRINNDSEETEGVPGGADDPSLFQGFPILFGSELWKCSGYVPKKFNFRYREFPCWEKEQDDGEDEAKADGSPENVIDRGAGVLYSLSKEGGVVSMRGGQSKGGGSDRKGSKDRKLENGESKKLGSPGLSKKEKGIGRSIVVHCSKRSREDLGSSKDRGVKKKSKASHREQDDVKKSKVQNFKAASNGSLSEGSNIEKPKRNAATDEGNLILRSPEVAGLGCSIEKRVKAEKPGHDATDSSQKSAKTDAVVVEKDNNTISPIKKEGLVLDVMDKNQGVLPVVPEGRTSDISTLKPITEDVDNARVEVNNTGVAKDIETTVTLISGHCASKTESDIDNPNGVLRSHPSDIDVELHCSEQISSPDRECEDFKRNEAVATSSQPLGQEVQDNGKTFEALSGNQLVKDEELVENQCNNKVNCEGLENSVEVQRTLSDIKEVSKVTGEISKLSGEIRPPPASYHKTVSVGKSSPSSSTIVISRSCLSDKNRAGSSQNHSSIGKRALSNLSMDQSKSSTNAVLKASQPSKPLTSPSLKHHTSLGKDSSRHLFSKKSSTDGALLPSSTDKTAATQQTQHASTGQSKNTASAGQHRGEKVLQPNLQSSKSTQSSLGHLPPSSSAPAGLSDEELALLLHQELNSSPRVPRVPRVRNAGSLPQLSSASATSIFNKRSASSGGKDQQTFSRRKNKDGSRNSRDLDNEARKVDRAPSSPDSVKTSDATQAECESIHSVRKNGEDVSTSAANSGPSSTDANERKSSSTRDSPVNKPEDDTGTNKGLAPIHRTLPGLIAEIMGAGRRMTYEELCNAVLPHWQNLRKHNGERYAYSSHSQAVLDCLRNRSEWARLVDRGPKTSASRKKRKVDVEPSNTESEDGEDRTRRTGKSKSFDSNKDEFPKGRRKARKRRRLALRGRGVKDDRRRTKKGAGSDDSGSFSNSSEDSGSSDDDSQGSGRAAKSEVSASSADNAAL
uniref:Zinc finger PHD-type domain-containing protein n=1 Tax=Chenopodium quinoa TaxID=63459 RepID=A0A803L5D6_CHEQI